ncbi:gamma-glutamyl-gamma-aminobutyrate hydrolase family protein [Thalassotalea ponticola]|uniref:gamma-glutamyl-gamma-aminobutyrate hydrolase family protein n=1 Tax=Thalassotalea ponticola TaxID=1523392 RepID=UPI0025B4BA2E|nr:gamma-glutamyl-gamma-aminobutyrate hydrolase family protein [Thalassotalea ponticola]MDN3652696.1 gamma-glutamyl-gamma-aminobutyrate hydrolase family protein [Thalassotalea ponticola]
MDKRPVIAVSGNHKTWAPAWWCTALALRLCGAQPRRLSTAHPWQGPLPDAIVIGGGNDISPEHYGAKVEAKVKLDLNRDALEIKCIKQALKQRIPILGICRGAQLINVVMGGSLHNDIRKLRHFTYNRPGLLPTKQVRLKPQSMIAAITGKNKLRVNSLHHQAVDQLGDELQASGWDLDQITQAIESSQGHHLLGVQWHPEYLCYLPSQLNIFRWLVKQCRVHQTQ